MPIGVYTRTEEHKKRISMSMKKNWQEPSYIEKQKESFVGRIQTKKTRDKISIGNKGKVRTEKIKKNLSRILIGNQRALGYEHTENAKRIMSNMALKRWQNPENREKYLKAIFAGNDLSPNIPEKKLRRILNNLFPKEYKFVGDGKTFIGGKCPDFINVNGQKKIIELFGDYWHSKKVTGLKKKIHRQQRQTHFKGYGFSTCVVWERELENISKVRKKLIKFHRDITVKI